MYYLGMSSMRVIEIRTYKLVPGFRDRFHQHILEDSLPLLKSVEMDVVCYGPSLNDPDGYFLIRSYASVDVLQRTQDALYSSDAWRKGPREAIVSLILSDANAVMWLSDEAIAEIRKAFEV